MKKAAGYYWKTFLSILAESLSIQTVPVLFGVQKLKTVPASRQEFEVFDSLFSDCFFSSSHEAPICCSFQRVESYLNFLVVGEPCEWVTNSSAVWHRIAVLLSVQRFCIPEANIPLFRLLL